MTLPDVVETVGGSLNPGWVERLMGWPQGWTSLEPMPSCAIPAGWGEAWEGDCPRTATGVRDRVARLRAIGNGQMPQCAALAWRVLQEGNGGV